ncbi:MAG: nucleotidyltransferase family protein [Lentisphaeraceae bacterium]|nr:nucleotidyltransferase family protein [Lentisphaeraceae bacterium]
MGGNLHGDKLEAAIISPLTPISQAVKHMDVEAALVVDKSGKLCGMITDGDIRRSFLAGAALDTPVSEIMTINPVTVNKGTPQMAIMALMMQKKIRHLPVVDKQNRPVALELLKNQLEDLEPAEAVVMAGGKGTRLHPLTLNTPKPLLKVGKETILDNILQKLEGNGIQDVVLAVNHFAEQIVDHVGDGSRHNLHVNYLQEEQALGTAGGLTLLSKKPESSFLVMNGDLLTELDFRSLVKFHRESNCCMTVCVRRHSIKIPYGVIEMAKDNLTIEQVVEKPDHEFLVNAGIYMLEPKMVELIPKGNFFDMVQLMNAALAKGWNVGAFPVLEYWKDIGQHDQIQEARQESKQRKVAKYGAFTVPADFLVSEAVS